MHRRQFIGGSVTVGTVAIAGCTGVLGGNPEDAAEEYFNALEEGDVDKANEVLHPESEIYPHEEGDFESDFSLSLNEINQATAEGVFESEASDEEVEVATDEEVELFAEEFRRIGEEVVEDTDSDDYAFVIVSYDEGEDEREISQLMIQDDGDWYVHTIGLV